MTSPRIDAPRNRDEMYLLFKTLYDELEGHVLDRALGKRVQHMVSRIRRTEGGLGDLNIHHTPAPSILPGRPHLYEEPGLYAFFGAEPAVDNWVDHMATIYLDTTLPGHTQIFEEVKTDIREYILDCWSGVTIEEALETIAEDCSGGLLRVG